MRATRIVLLTAAAIPMLALQPAPAVPTGIGDGGPATAARLKPGGLAIESSTGAIFVADRLHNLIRVVKPDGTITTIGGTGVYGHSGDGGPALQADMAPVRLVFRDRALYFSETTITSDPASVVNSWNTIRRIDGSGTITTIAGSNRGGFAGDGGPAQAALLSAPDGIAYDAFGNLYIADLGNGRIRKVDFLGRMSTVRNANQPRGISRGGSGCIWYAEGRHVGPMQQIDGSPCLQLQGFGSGEAGHQGDGGLGFFAQFRVPMDAVQDADGNVYIADPNSTGHTIRKVDQTFTITTAFTDVPAHDLELAPDGRTLYAATECQVLRLGPNRLVSVIAGLPDCA